MEEKDGAVANDGAEIERHAVERQMPGIDSRYMSQAHAPVAAAGGAAARRRIEFVVLVHGSIPDIGMVHLGAVVNPATGEMAEGFKAFKKEDRFFKIPEHMSLNLYGEHQ